MKVRKKNLPLLIVISLIFEVNIGYSQSISFDSIVSIDPESFDRFVFAYEHSKPNAFYSLDSIVLAKLSKGYFVTEEAIVSSVKLMYNEIRTTEGAELTKVIKYLDELIALLYKRDLLKAKLLILKHTYMSRIEGNDAQGTGVVIDSIMGEIILISENTISEFVNIKLRHLLDLAMSKELSGEKIKAEKYYNEVQDYPFWTIKDEKLRSRVRGYYIQACKRCIELNRGNIKGLRSIAYVPSVADDVEPFLRAYVEELGVSWKKFNDDDN